MIAELSLIVDLLKKLSLRSTPPISQPDPHASFDPIVSKPMQLDLFELGKIEVITQPVVLPPISGEDLTQWWLDAIKDIPITSLPTKAR